jgi:DNA-binding MarR family transcriptional regulator
VPQPKTPVPEWVLHLDEAVTRVSRAARSPRLHEMMGRAARVELGEHLHLTLAMIGAGQPVRVSDLATQLDVERSTVSRRVAELVNLGLVVRAADPGDRRAAALSLTRAGQRSLARIRDAWHRTLADLTAGWDPKQRDDAINSLSALAAALEELLATNAKADGS